MPGLTFIEVLEARIAPAFAAIFELSSLNGFNGFHLGGVAERDFAGTVSNAGDVNGDGFDDLIVGAQGVDANGYDSGASYVVFGKGTGFDVNFDLASLDGNNGFQIGGAAAFDYSGSSVSAAGDVNGDGFGDLIIGAEKASPNGVNYAGESYVVFGRVGGFPAFLNLSALNGRDGFSISGRTEYDYSGHSVSGAGDINGDGFDDVIIGARFAAGTEPLAGASYVVFGKARGFAPKLNIAELNGSNGFTLAGEAGFDFSGSSVSAAGDVNGDGFGDVIIGAPLADPNGRNSGASYVVFGQSTGFAVYIDLSTLDGSNGFKVNGVAEGDSSGQSVSSSGDVNGDGVDDVIIGAPGADPNGENSGASYVVFGKASQFPANLNLADLDGGNGFKLNGAAPDDGSGSWVSGAGDMNGDGFADLIIGAPGADPNGSDSGASYVIFGKASGFAATLNLSELDGPNGFTIHGESAGDRAGQCISAAGDLNGDGFGDLIIGAFTASLNATKSGASYVIFGNGPPFISVGDAVAIEGDRGTRGLTFAVTLSFASTEVVTVQFSTIDGTALAGSDYVALLNQTLEFAPGETTRTIVVTVNGDTAIEPDETFFIRLFAPTNANLGKAGGVGAIVSDDHVQLVISRSGDRATFTDIDGDLVTVTTSRGAFLQESFVFEYGQLIAINLGASGLGSDLIAFHGAKIAARATPAGGGDGMVNVSAFNAIGVNLEAVKIDGALGEIDVGAGFRGKMALKSLKAVSLGFDSGTESTFAGKVGALKIEHDVKGVIEISGDMVKRVLIGGNLGGSVEGTVAGLLEATGGIGSVVIKGSVVGGAARSGIVVGGRLGSIKIGGDLRSADPERPVTISALGDLSATNTKDAIALTKLTVGGNVSNAEVLAGYQRDGAPSNPNAGIGSIVVSGDWSASSAAAGVADISGDGFGRNDTLVAGDTMPQLIARIGSVIIHGAATGGDRATADHFGIAAQQIGRVVAGGARPFFTLTADDILIDAVNGDFRVVDFA